MLQQPFFSPKSTCIARQRSVGTNNSVAGNHNPERVSAISCGHCPNGFFITHPSGKRQIRFCFTKWNLQQCPPDRLLKIGSLGLHLKIKHLPFAFKVFLQLANGFCYRGWYRLIGWLLRGEFRWNIHTRYNRNARFGTRNPHLPQGRLKKNGLPFHTTKVADKGLYLHKKEVAIYCGDLSIPVLHTYSDN